MNPTATTNPRRLFIISPEPHSLQTVPDLLHALTGVPIGDLPDATPTPTTTATTAINAPPRKTKTLAGYTTHPPLHLRTKYYSADVPIWVDEVPFPTSTSDTAEVKTGDVEVKATDTGTEATNTNTNTESKATNPEITATQWKTEFLSPEARIVRDAIGAVIVCVRNPEPSSFSFPFPSLPSGAGAGANAGAGVDGGAGGVGVGVDPTTRDDVKAIKDFVRVVGDVRARAEEERDGEGGDIPGLLVFVGKEGGRREEWGQKGREGGGDVDIDIDGDGGGGGGGGGEDDGDVPFSAGWWEDQLFDDGQIGFEVVCWDSWAKAKAGGDGDGDRDGDGDGGRNRFGELQGINRIKEVLETHEWTSSSASADDHDTGLGLGLGLDDDELEAELLGLDADAEAGETGFNLEVNELEREMLGLRMAIGRDDHDNDDGHDDDDDDGGDGESKVESMEALMLRMRAIKDMSSDLPEAERKKFAAKAVRDIMKEL